jgi:hypothetical protein
MINQFTASQNEWASSSMATHTTRGATKISLPWKKAEKKTLSAGLLLALGVAGMFVG